MPSDLSVILLHDEMADRTGKIVTTSLTLIDLHDIARSSRTFGAREFFVAHSSTEMRKIAKTLKSHWEEGFGASYNPNRKEALEIVSVVETLDDAIHRIAVRTGRAPRLIATSARDGASRITFPDLRKTLDDGVPSLIMFGTGWGMCDALLDRADLFLEPVRGCGDYNHLSVRSACAIILDRLCGER